MTRLAMLLVLLSACAPPCEDTPLAPVSAPPAFLVELSEHGSPERPQDGGPPSLDVPRSALALYAADGSILSDRWLDTTTRWQGARGTFDGLDPLPWHQEPARVTLAIDDPPSLVAINPADASIVRNLALPPGGPITDVASSLLARADGLALINLESGATIRPIDLEALAGEGTRPGRVAPFANGTLAVGLARADEELGAVAIVDGTSATAAPARLDLAGLRGCTEVSALQGEPSRVAVLCAREPAGLALLEAGESVRVVTIRAGILPANAEALVAASDGWVAVLARGSEETPDLLVAINLDTGALVRLREERWSPRFGPALGEGAFDPMTRELWWPSVELGVARFRLEPTGFVAIAPLATPTCQRSPARRIRHLP